jgi:hypothetical protein
MKSGQVIQDFLVENEITQTYDTIISLTIRM